MECYSQAAVVVYKEHLDQAWSGNSQLSVGHASKGGGEQSRGTSRDGEPAGLSRTKKSVAIDVAAP